MPARAKGKTPGRPTRNSQRQIDENPSTPMWAPASADMFASPAFTPPQSPPLRQIRDGRITKQSKPVAKSRRQTLLMAAKTTSPAMTRGRRSTMLPSEMKRISPLVNQRRISVYQRRGAKQTEFKPPQPVPAKRQTVKRSPAKKAPVKKIPAKKASPKISSSKKEITPKKVTRPRSRSTGKSPDKNQGKANVSSTKANVSSTKTRVNTSNTATPKPSTPVSVRSSVRRSTRKTRQMASPAPVTPKINTPKTPAPQTPKGKSTISDSTKVSPRTSELMKKKSLRLSLVKSPLAVEKSKSELSFSSFTSSPYVKNSVSLKSSLTKIKTPIMKVSPGKGKVLRVRDSPVITPVNKVLEKLRAEGNDSLKRVKIVSNDKESDPHKVYRKTPSRGKTLTDTMLHAVIRNETPPKAARILGKTPLHSTKKPAVKPKKLTESMMSPKTSTPVGLRKRRADFTAPLSEIQHSKKRAVKSNLSMEESIMSEAEITADMSVANIQDVRPTSWWGWCTIL